MGGPIVRTGTTPKFWQNYDRIFNSAGAKKSTSKDSGPAKAEAKSAKKKSPKKAAGKKKKK